MYFKPSWHTLIVGVAAIILIVITVMGIHTLRQAAQVNNVDNAPARVSIDTVDNDDQTVDVEFSAVWRSGLYYITDNEGRYRVNPFWLEKGRTKWIRIRRDQPFSQDGEVYTVSFNGKPGEKHAESIVSTQLFPMKINT